MSEKLTVIAYATAKKGKERETLELLSGLVAPTRAESGCINYDLHQLLDDPCQFVFYENWTSKAALDLHLQTPHIKNMKEKSPALLAEPVRIALLRQV